MSPVIGRTANNWGDGYGEKTTNMSNTSTWRRAGLYPSNTVNPMNNMERDNLVRFDQIGTLMKTWSMVNIIGVNPSVFISSFTSVLYFSFSRMTFTIAGVWNAWREPDAANAEHAERSWIDQP